MRRTYKVFDRLVAKESSTVASAGATQKKANGRLADSFTAGMKMMKEKDEEDYFGAQTMTGKEAKNRKKMAKKANRDKDLVHTFDTLQNFQYLKSKVGDRSVPSKLHGRHS